MCIRDRCVCAARQSGPTYVQSSKQQATSSQEPPRQRPPPLPPCTGTSHKPSCPPPPPLVAGSHRCSRLAAAADAEATLVASHYGLVGPWLQRASACCLLARVGRQFIGIGRRAVSQSSSSSSSSSSSVAGGGGTLMARHRRPYVYSTYMYTVDASCLKMAL